MVVAGDCLVEGMDVEGAEGAAERGLLLAGQGLVAEHQELVLEQRRADGRPRRLVEGVRQVDAAYLGAERAAEPSDFHPRPPRYPRDAASAGRGAPSEPASAWSAAPYPASTPPATRPYAC